MRLIPERWCVPAGVALLVLTAKVVPAQSPEDAEAHRAALQQRAAALKPRPEQLRWQQIPWVLDPAEAIRIAKEEKRPLFFWAAGGRRRDGVPLERC